MSASAIATPGSVQRESQTTTPRSTAEDSPSSRQPSPASSTEDIQKIAYALWQQRGCPSSDTSHATTPEETAGRGVAAEGEGGLVLRRYAPNERRR